MDQEIKRALAGIPLGAIRYFRQAGSTNTEAMRWAEKGAPDLAIVIADEQTAGRGRQGRRWLTPANSALAFSMILKGFDSGSLDQMASMTYRLNGLGAVAVCQTLYLDYGLEAKIKWPNDILLNKRKAAGILAESQWQGYTLQAVILGIGVNVKPAAIPLSKTTAFPATCVESAAGKPVNRLELLRNILYRLLNWREHLNDPTFISYWQANLAYRNKPVSITTSLDSGEKRKHQGILLGLDHNGRLKLLDQHGQISHFAIGEIQMLRAISY
jgi:BirA family biotin operon repressor/biotin-[acetyl-CoA-carboxylase] ligase